MAEKPGCSKASKVAEKPGCSKASKIAEKPVPTSKESPVAETRDDDLLVDGKNKYPLYCLRCKVALLGEQDALHIKREVYCLPQFGKFKTIHWGDSPERLVDWWLVEGKVMSQTRFINATNPVNSAGIEYLTCIQCNTGPFGFHFTEVNEWYIAAARVEHGYKLSDTWFSLSTHVTKRAACKKDGKNSTTLYCIGCKTGIVGDELALCIKREYSLPFIAFDSVFWDEFERLHDWWFIDGRNRDKIRSVMMTNVQDVTGLVYLTCSTCTFGPFGFHLARHDELYIAVDRVEQHYYRHEPLNLNDSEFELI